jgi:exodeoxyribonuclease VII small subunit
LTAKRALGHRYRFMPAKNPPPEAPTAAEAVATQPEPSFEQILEQLEGVVSELERGELPLEQALATFERGVGLSRLGAGKLDAAERRIEVLLGNGELRPLTDDSPADGAPRAASHAEGARKP